MISIIVKRKKQQQYRKFAGTIHISSLSEKNPPNLISVASHSNGYFREPVWKLVQIGKCSRRVIRAMKNIKSNL